LDQSRLTMKQLQDFSFNADQACCVAGQNAPLLKELIRVAQDLGPTLHAVRQLSPPLKKLFFNLDPLITVSRTGLPATAEFLKGLGCTPQPGLSCPPSPATQTLLPALGNFLEQLNPILDWLGQHQQLVSDFISNGGTSLSATTTTFGGSGLTCNGQPCGHYLRQFGLTGGESLSIYENRPPTNRGNTYPEPILATPAVGRHESLPAWDCNNTGGQHGPIGDAPTGQPACWVAPPLGRLLGQPQKFPHVLAARYPSR
jgi:hypothetical protein